MGSSFLAFAFWEDAELLNQDTLSAQGLGKKPSPRRGWKSTHTHTHTHVLSRAHHNLHPLFSFSLRVYMCYPAATSTGVGCHGDSAAATHGAPTGRAAGSHHPLEAPPTQARGNREMNICLAQIIHLQYITSQFGYQVY